MTGRQGKIAQRNRALFQRGFENKVFKSRQSGRSGRTHRGASALLLSGLAFALLQAFSNTPAQSIEDYTTLLIDGGSKSRTNWNFELYDDLICAQSVDGISSLCNSAKKVVAEDNVIVLSSWNSLDLKAFSGSFSLSNDQYAAWVNNSYAFTLNHPVVANWDYATQGYKHMTDDAEPMSVIAVKNLSTEKIIGAPTLTIDPEIGRIMRNNFHGRFYLVGLELDFGPQLGLSRATQNSQVNWAGGNLVNIYEGAAQYPLASLALQTWEKWGYYTYTEETDTWVYHTLNTYNFYTSPQTIQSPLFVTTNLYVGQSGKTNFGTFNLIFNGSDEDFFASVGSESSGALDQTLRIAQLIQVTATSALPRSLKNSDTLSSSTISPIEMANSNAVGTFTFSLEDGSTITTMPLYRADGVRFAAREAVTFNSTVTIDQSNTVNAAGESQNGIWGTVTYTGDTIYLEKAKAGESVPLVIDSSLLSGNALYSASAFTLLKALQGEGGFIYDGVALGVMTLDGAAVASSLNTLSGTVEVASGSLVLKNAALGSEGALYGYAASLVIDTDSSVQLQGAQTVGSLFTEASSTLELAAGSVLTLSGWEQSSAASAQVSAITSSYEAGSSVLQGSGTLRVSGLNLSVAGRNAGFTGTVVIASGSTVSVDASDAFGSGTVRFSGQTDEAADTARLTVNLKARSDTGLESFTLKSLLEESGVGILYLQNLKGKTFAFNERQTSFDGLMILRKGAFTLEQGLLSRGDLTLSEASRLTISGHETIANLTLDTEGNGTVLIDNLSKENTLSVSGTLAWDSPALVSMTLDGTEHAAVLKTETLTNEDNRDYGIFNVTYTGSVSQLEAVIPHTTSGSIFEAIPFVQLLEVADTTEELTAQGYSGSLNFTFANGEALSRVALYRKDGVRFAASADAAVDSVLTVIHSGTRTASGESLNGLWGTISYGDTIYLEAASDEAVTLLMDQEFFAGRGLTESSSFLLAMRFLGEGGFIYNGTGVGNLTLDGAILEGATNTFSGSVEVQSGILTMKNAALGSPSAEYGYARALIIDAAGGADLIGAQTLGSLTATSLNTAATGLYLTNDSALTLTGRDFTDASAALTSSIASDYGDGVGTYSTLFGSGSLIIDGTTLTVTGRNAGFSGTVTVRGNAEVQIDAADGLGTGYVVFERVAASDAPTLTVDLSARSAESLANAPISVGLVGTSAATLNLKDLAGAQFTFDAEQLAFNGTMRLSNGAYALENNILTGASLELGRNAALTLEGSRTLENLTVGFDFGTNIVVSGSTSGSLLTVSDTLTVASPLTLSMQQSDGVLISAANLTVTTDSGVFGSIALSYASLEALYQDAEHLARGTALDATVPLLQLVRFESTDSVLTGSAGTFSLTLEDGSTLSELPLYSTAGERYAAHVAASVAPNLTWRADNALDASDNALNGVYANAVLGGNTVYLEEASADKIKLVINSALLAKSVAGGAAVLHKALIGEGGFTFEGDEIVSNLLLDGAAVEGLTNSFSGEAAVLSGVLTLQNAALGSSVGLYGHARSLRIVKEGGAALKGSQSVGRLELTSNNSVATGLELTDGAVLTLDGLNFEEPDSVLISHIYSDYGQGAGTYSSLFGSGSLVVSGTTLRVSGRNALFSGDITLDEGAELYIDASDALGTGRLSFTDTASVLTIDLSERLDSGLSDFVLSNVISESAHATVRIDDLAQKSFAFNASQGAFEGALYYANGSFTLDDQQLAQADLTLGSAGLLRVLGQQRVKTLTVAEDAAGVVLALGDISAKNTLSVTDTLTISTPMTVEVDIDDIALADNNLTLVELAHTPQIVATLVSAGSIQNASGAGDFSVVNKAGEVENHIASVLQDSDGSKLATLYTAAEALVSSSAIQLAGLLSEVQIEGGKTLTLESVKGIDTFNAKITENRSAGLSGNLTVRIDSDKTFTLSNSENGFTGNVTVISNNAAGYTEPGHLILGSDNALGSASAHAGTVYLVNGSELELDGVSQSVSLVLSRDEDLSSPAAITGTIHLKNNAHLTITNFESLDKTPISSILDVDETSTLTLIGSGENIYFTFHPDQYLDSTATFKGTLDLHGVTIQSYEGSDRTDAEVTQVGAKTSFILSEDSALELNRLGYSMNDLELDGGTIRVSAEALSSNDLSKYVLTSNKVVIDGDVTFELAMDPTSFEPSAESVAELQKLNILRQEQEGGNHILNLIGFDQENNALTEENLYENYDASKVSVVFVKADGTRVNLEDLNDDNYLKLKADDAYGNNTRYYGMGAHTDDDGLHVDKRLLAVDVTGDKLVLQSDLTASEVSAMQRSSTLSLGTALSFSSRIYGDGDLVIAANPESEDASSIYLVNGENAFTGRTIVESGATLVVAVDHALGSGQAVTSELALSENASTRILAGVEQTLPAVSMKAGAALSVGRTESDAPAALTITERLSVLQSGVSTLSILGGSTVLLGDSAEIVSQGGTLDIGIEAGSTLHLESLSASRTLGDEVRLNGQGTLSFSDKSSLTVTASNPDWSGTTKVGADSELVLWQADSLGTGSIVLDSTSQVVLALENTEETTALFNTRLAGQGAIVAEASNVYLADLADWRGDLAIDATSRVYVRAEELNAESVSGSGELHLYAAESVSGTPAAALSGFSGEIFIETGHVTVDAAEITSASSATYARAARASLLPSFTIEAGATLTLSGAANELRNAGHLNISKVAESSIASLTVANYYGGTLEAPSTLAFNVTENFAANSFEADTLTITGSASGYSKVSRVALTASGTDTALNGTYLIYYDKALEDYLSGTFKVESPDQGVAYGAETYYLLPQESGYALFGGLKALEILEALKNPDGSENDDAVVTPPDTEVSGDGHEGGGDEVAPPVDNPEVVEPPRGDNPVTPENPDQTEDSDAAPSTPNYEDEDDTVPTKPDSDSDSSDNGENGGNDASDNTSTDNSVIVDTETGSAFDWSSVNYSSVLRTSLGAYVVSYLAPRSIEYRFTDHFEADDLYDPTTGEKRRALAWLRQYGSNARYTMGDHQLKIKEKIGSTIFGLNVLENRWGTESVVTQAGLTFASYYLSSTSSSTIDSVYAPGSTKGRSFGKAFGLYGSLYVPSRFGAPWFFTEVWAQYINSTNKVHESGQDSIRYKGRGWVTSVEAGVSIPVWEKKTSENSLFVAVQPQVQAVYEGVRYGSFYDHTGTYVAPDNDLNMKMRFGARLLLEKKAEKSDKSLRGFLDVSRVRNSRARGVTMFNQVYKEQGDQDYTEINTGLEAKLNKRITVRAAVGFRDGREGYHEAHGSLGVRFTF